MKDTPAHGDADKLLLTMPEAARRLGVSRTYLYELVARREIVTVKLGKLHRVPVVALQVFIQRKLDEQGA